MTELLHPKTLLRDMVLGILEVTPNITAGDIGAQMGLAGSALYGLIGNLIKDKSIHASGERYVNKSYTACYSVGESGPFTLAPERLARRQKKPKKIKEPVAPRVNRNEMVRKHTSAADTTHKFKTQTWLSAIGEIDESTEQVSRLAAEDDADQERRSSSLPAESNATADQQNPAWQTTGRSFDLDQCSRGKRAKY